MIVTKENLDKLLKEGASIKGAWSSAQIRILVKDEEFKGGFPYPGWKIRLIGKEIKKEQIDEFLRLKNRHLSHKKRDISGQRTLESEINSHMASIKQEINKDKFDCSKCIHGLTQSCTDHPDNGCTYFADEVNEVYGPAYKQTA
jgi:hypothetical protein